MILPSHDRIFNLRATNRIDKDAVKAAVNVITLAEHLGVEVRGRSAKCPFHDDRSPSAWFHRDGFHCFACGLHLDCFGFVQRLTNCRFPEALRRCAEIAGFSVSAPGGGWSGVRRDGPPGRKPPPPPPPDPHFEERVKALTAFCSKARLDPRWRSHEPAFKYLARRGISAESAVKFGVGFVSDYGNASRWALERFSLAELQQAGLFNAKGNLRTFKHQLLLPAWLQGEVLALRARNIDWRSKALDGAKELGLGRDAAPYNLDLLLEEPDQVWLSEGGIDCLSLLELGLPAMGLPAAHLPWAWAGFFAGVPEVVLALDADETGREKTDHAGEVLRGAGCVVKRLRLPPGIKDVNEYLTAADTGEGV